MKIRFLVLCSILMMACDTVTTPQNAVECKDSVSLAGADSDSHGCKGSAGYTWSEVRQDCIRIWEAGVKIMPVGDITVAAYAVFAKDSAKVELFLPGAKQGEILDKRTLSTGESVWNIEDNDTKNLCKVDGLWRLTQRGKVTFKE